MNREEVEKMLGRFVSTFPNKLSIEQRKVAAKDFARFRVPTVADAIEDNARRFEWPNYPELLKACEVAERERDLSARESVPAQSFADIARGHSPQLAAVRDDLEVILRKHRGRWHKCSRSDAYRSNFGTSCKHQVYDVLITREPKDAEGNVASERTNELMAMAEAWANVIFEDPDTFRLALEDLRGNLPGGRAA